VGLSRLFPLLLQPLHFGGFPVDDVFELFDFWDDGRVLFLEFGNLVAEVFVFFFEFLEFGFVVFGDFEFEGASF
jgi:hypothetical protein